MVWAHSRGGSGLSVLSRVIDGARLFGSGKATERAGAIELGQRYKRAHWVVRGEDEILGNLQRRKGFVNMCESIFMSWKESSGFITCQQPWGKFLWLWLPDAWCVEWKHCPSGLFCGLNDKQDGLVLSLVFQSLCHCLFHHFDCWSSFVIDSLGGAHVNNAAKDFACS